MSSGAATRTSIGNEICNPSRSMTERTACTASRIAPRGTAYSISTNRTRRGEVNTSWEGAENRRAPMSLAAVLFSLGTSDGRRLPSAQTALNIVLARNSSSSHSRHGFRGRGVSPAGGGGLWRLTGGEAVVALRQRDVGVREPVELEVLVAVGELVELLHHPVERHRLLVRLEDEGRLALQGDGGDDPECAEPYPGGFEPLRLRLRRAVDDRPVPDH